MRLPDWYDPLSVLTLSAADSIDVKNMPFTEPDLEEIETSLFDLTKSDLFRLAELGVLIVLAAMAIFLVVRPLLAKLMPEPVTLDSSMSAAKTGAGANLPVVLDENGHPVMAGAPEADAGDGQDGSANRRRTNADLGLEEFEDKVRVDLVRQVRNAIEARPDDAVAVVRLWMDESPRTADG